MKLVTVLALLFLASSAFAEKKVLMMIPDDFMWPEYSEPRKLYEEAGFKVVTASKLEEEVRPDRRNKTEYPESRAIKADIVFEEVKIEDFDAITFVAGNGAWHDFFPNQKVHDLVKKAIESNKVVGLLCASTGLLGLVDNWDGSKPIAKGKKVVGYFRVEGILRHLGQVKYISGGQKEPGISVDGNLVTGRNPESSTMFGEAIIKTLNK